MWNIFAEFDLLGGLRETIKDIDYTLSTGKLGHSIDVLDPDDAAAKLRAAGIEVISVTRGYANSLIDVPPEQADAAVRALLGEPKPLTGMNNAAGFAPAGLTVIGPSGPARLAGWLLRKVFG